MKLSRLVFVRDNENVFPCFSFFFLVLFLTPWALRFIISTSHPTMAWIFYRCVITLCYFYLLTLLILAFEKVCKIRNIKRRIENKYKLTIIWTCFFIEKKIKKKWKLGLIISINYIGSHSRKFLETIGFHRWNTEITRYPSSFTLITLW